MNKSNKTAGVSKRHLGHVLFLCYSLAFALVLCSCAPATTVLNEDYYKNMVVANINGVDVKRSDIGESLETAENKAINDYVQAQLMDSFFKDITITDAEVDVQLKMLKTQVGEENWPMYLAYYGGGSEESFKVQVRNNIKQEKKLKTYTEVAVISEDEAKAAYTKEPNKYNTVVMDVVFAEDAEGLDKGVALVKEGKTLEEIATAMGITIRKDEHAYYNFKGFVQDFNVAKVGDIVYTTSDSGTFAIGKVTALQGTYDSVHDAVKEGLTSEKCFTFMEEDYQKYLDTSKVTVLGAPLDLSKKETEGDAEPETNITDGENDPTELVPESEVVEPSKTPEG